MLKLKLNEMKTKCMIFGGQSDIPILMNGQRIDVVDEFKYLGIIVNFNLNFKSNVQYFIKKIAKKVSLLKRIKKRLDKDTRLLLYKSLIAPHYDYCSTILFLLSDCDIEKLQKLQNRAMRVILDASPREHISDMLNRCELLGVKQRIYFNVLLFMYKIQKGMMPAYLSSMFKTISNVKPYNLRNSNNMRPPHYMTTNAQCSLE